MDISRVSAIWLHSEGAYLRLLHCPVMLNTGRDPRTAPLLAHRRRARPRHLRQRGPGIVLSRLPPLRLDSAGHAVLPGHSQTHATGEALRRCSDRRRLVLRDRRWRTARQRGRRVQRGSFQLPLREHPGHRPRRDGTSPLPFPSSSWPSSSCSSTISFR